MLYPLNCRGTLLDLSRPRIMGILNVTPDSFSDGGRYLDPAQALAQAERMAAEGAGLIDIGGYSSRPGAAHISAAEELDRIGPVIEGVRQALPGLLISVDTFRPEVAEAALGLGAHLINDISAGRGLDGAEDSGMLALLAEYPDVPLILMHMQGTPQTMQQAPAYGEVCGEVRQFFVERVNAARRAGLRDLILDPGFGFGKSLAHNYQLVEDFARFQALGLPLLAGLSRKSMLYRLFGTGPEDVLPQATALHLKVLESGANLLRVHDVEAAVRLVRMYTFMKQAHGTV
jgi:dihydropteroate synthase